MFLGINYGGTHDSSVTLVDAKGNVKLAVSEERFTRLKKDGSFPRMALNHCFDPAQVDEIALPYLESSAESSKLAENRDPLYREELLARSIAEYNLSSCPPEWYTAHQELDKPLFFFDHHLSHAAAGYYMSGLEEAMIVTSDNSAPNSPWNMGIYKATPAGIQGLHMASNRFYHALCSIYTVVTALLGFRPNVHEGKITGLASYGEDNLECEAALWELFEQIGNSRYRLYEWINWMKSDAIPLLETNRAVTSYYRAQLKEFSDKQIARAVQRLVEKKTCALITKALVSYPARNIILSGGFFANVKVNLEVKRLGFENIFVCPAMGDEGISLGAAVLRWSQASGETLYREKLRHLYLGGVPIENEVAQLEELGVNYTMLKQEEAAQVLARLLSEGKTIARVVGDMEFGPRALGNRSILYQATDPSVNDWLNKKLKRTEFMPFAPILRAERAAEMFDLAELSGAEHTAQYMTICLHCQPQVRQHSPAVVHVDNTARPQLVNRELNPELYAVLTCYEELTGLPMLINTSFNVHDEPIVASACDAVIGFFQSELDYLVLGNTLVNRLANPLWCKITKEFASDSLKIEKMAKAGLSHLLGSHIIRLQEGLDWANEQIQTYQTEANHLLAQFNSYTQHSNLTKAQLDNYVEHLESDIADLKTALAKREAEMAIRQVQLSAGYYHDWTAKNEHINWLEKRLAEVETPHQNTKLQPVVKLASQILKRIKNR